MRQANFKNIEDFLLDETFCEWMASNKKQHHTFWLDWIQLNPNKKEMLEEAESLYRDLNFKENKLSDSFIENEYEKLHKELNTNHNLHIALKKQKEQKLLFLRSAAAILILGVSGWLAYFFLFSATIYKTNYGALEQITLPDNSKVVLQANSSLKIGKNWDNQQPREVWLEGEAFFIVEKAQSSNNRFVVHTEQLDVEVLGTAFDVLQRDQRTRVVLNEGKVKVKFNDQQTLLENRITNENDLLPGEMIEYNAEKANFTKEKVIAKNYSSWTQNKLTFNDIPLKELAIILKDIYGYDVQFEEQQLSEKRITGTIPNQDLDVLLGAVKQIFDLEITKSKNEIIFHN